MTVGAGVWLGHRQINATLHGKAGVRLSAFTRASLAQKPSVADLPASELSVGRRKPEPTPGTFRPFLDALPIPPSVMLPRFGPNGGLAM